MDDNHLYITKEELEEFKRLAFKEYGVKLTDEQAYEQGSALLRLMDCVLDKTLQEKKEESVRRNTDEQTT